MKNEGHQSFFFVCTKKNFSYVEKNEIIKEMQKFDSQRKPKMGGKNAEVCEMYIIFPVKKKREIIIIIFNNTCEP